MSSKTSEKDTCGCLAAVQLVWAIMNDFIAKLCALHLAMFALIG